MKILITGIAGFIGSHLAISLLESHHNIQIIGIDNLNDRYDVALKQYRLSCIYNAYKSHDLPIGSSLSTKSFVFIKADICDQALVDSIFEEYKPDVVLHFAAHAGVRESLDRAAEYINTNINGFLNILNACKLVNSKLGSSFCKLIYASSSSIYGGNALPYSELDKSETPSSIYAVTKKTDELLAFTYSNLFNITTVGLRFFSVYGPAGRPDMAYYKYTEKLSHGDKIDVYNYGKHKRDFTYIDDVVECVNRVIFLSDDSLPKYSIFNIGNGNPIKLIDFILSLSSIMKKYKLLPADSNIFDYMNLCPIQKGDVEDTEADMTLFRKYYHYVPSTTVSDGLEKFILWYSDYITKKI